MTGKEQERLKRLERRAEHLKSRIAENLRTGHDYDAAELSALTWAIDFIKGATGNEDKGNNEPLSL